MYTYLEQKPFVFTEEGQRTFLKIRDNVNNLCELSGAVSMEKAIAGTSGNSWELLACVDRLVELGELREVTNSDAVPGLNRIFIKIK
jgi:hypothetical protein